MRWTRGSVPEEVYTRAMAARDPGPATIHWDDSTPIHLCIVEPRRHPLLPFALNRAALLYKGRAGFTLVTSRPGRAAVEETLRGWTGHRVLLTEDLCGKSNLAIEEYNELMTSESFWRGFPADRHVLIFQTDVLLLRPCDDAFLLYDYVGAPWPWQPPGTSWGVGGNGGYSLRYAGAMTEAIRRLERPPREPEDVFYSRAAAMGIIQCPPTAVAAAFSAEHLPPPDGGRPTGVHQVYRFWDSETLDALL